MKYKLSLLVITLIFFGFGCSYNNKPIEKNIVEVVEKVDKQTDLVYSQLKNVSLKLDLYLPKTNTTKPKPVIVFIHGGGWIEGTKIDCPGVDFANKGYAVACVDYRLATKIGKTCLQENSFPVQIHDIKTAIRWLRKNANQYNFDKDNFAVMGVSSGAHLAALSGVSENDEYLKGQDNLGYSDKVSAVVDWYGPVDYRKAPPKIVFEENICDIEEQLLNKKYGGEETQYFYWTKAWGIFLGGSLIDPNILEKGRLASPLTYLDKNDPPFIVIHGQIDDMIPPAQSKLLVDSLKKIGVEVEYITPNLSGHGYLKDGKMNPEFFNPTIKFLDKYLKNN